VALVLVAAAALALPASAASIQPKLLVLRAGDVPARYFFDKDNAMTLFPSDLGTSVDRRRILARSGFVTAYVELFRNTDPPRWRSINSAAYVFRSAAGARIFLAWLDKGVRKETGGTVQRRPVGLGDEGWSYVSSSREDGTQVVWRVGRVLAVLGCEQMTGHQGLALLLAREQQRRLATALG